MASEVVPESIVSATIVERREPAGELPVRGREILAVLLAVVLCDLTLYRGAGLAGVAVLFLVAPGLLVLGSPAPRLGGRFWLASAMLVLLAGRMIWLGSALAVAAGFALVVAVATVLVGWRPGVPDVIWYALQTTVAGGLGLARYARAIVRRGPAIPSSVWFNVGLPVAALALFGTLFVLANPDLATGVADTARTVWRNLSGWLGSLEPSWLEVAFWGLVAWLTAGLLRPLRRLGGSPPTEPAAGLLLYPPAVPQEAAAPYTAIRNTLAAVSALFAVYLVFEFKTLWFRVFPQGFYYSGYAHEGAAWLTIALAVSTVVLSVAFRGGVLQDPRLPRLKRWAWLWSAENFVLAIAVYHRLYIYIGFNGMTRMRMVGLFGMSAVVVGFILVVWKIASRRDFAWLFHRHLWTVAVAAYLYALTPVDALVHTYNVRRVLAGDPAPSVQIGWHPISAEGLLVLHPLVRCEDQAIREGIRALLAERAAELELTAERRAQLGWTATQLADRVLLERLRRVSEDWDEYRDPAASAAAWQSFRKYAYHWY
jgi:hypothetical protein